MTGSDDFEQALRQPNLSPVISHLSGNLFTTHYFSTPILLTVDNSFMLCIILTKYKNLNIKPDSKLG